MAQGFKQLLNEQKKYLEHFTPEEVVAKLDSRPIYQYPLRFQFPSIRDIYREPGTVKQFISDSKIELPYVMGEKPIPQDPATYEKNIENFIGTASIPIGLAGPLRVNGLNAQDDYLIPLATSEAALVASFHRGSKAITMSGGASSMCIIERISRAPIFIFNNIKEALAFANWIINQMDNLKTAAESTTRFGKLLDVNLNVNGSDVVLILDYYPGDAAGQNMVTIASEHACQWILENSIVPIKRWYIESNLSGDKKATAISFIKTRGKKVVSEVIIPESICKSVLKATPAQIFDAWKVSIVSTCQSGAIGSQSHYANGLTALFIATGQDVACISECSIGITQYDITDDGSLKVNVSTPNLTVGTVGGGTSLPTQKECLNLLGCAGSGGARKFAEICGALILAGEISITAAIASGDFTSAHRTLARGK